MHPLKILIAALLAGGATIRWLPPPQPRRLRSAVQSWRRSAPVLGAAMGIVVNAVVLPPFHPAMRAYDTMTGLVGHGTLARPRAWMATGR
ncbi:hypothetical protein [Streptomyces sp. AF1A]|uniref:hypothetical protein n=1 Tax=Streptomyces sp. AF1A TaxID=3394350 RepID=UPI0039BC8BCA